ncbi:Kelch domain-containing protein 2 [Bulinus truncatus]|nr:Kelch domain-containing protein 2 [Bulinus truncatus]
MALHKKCLRFSQTWRSNYDEESYYRRERCGHNAVCINNELLIWGGYNDSVEGGSTYCERDVILNYNLDLDLWTCVKTNGELPKHRSGASGALLWPYWYILCGHTFEGDTNDVHRLNLISLVWEKLNPSGLSISPRDKSSCWVYRSRIYCFGGFGSKPSKYLWDNENDKFTLEPMNFRGWNDQVLYFDTDQMEWVLVACKGPKPKGRAAHTTVCINSIVYLFGGRHKSKRMNDLHCFNLETHTWSGTKYCKGNQPIGRSWHSMTAISHSELIIYGGFSNDNEPLDDMWLLDVDCFCWTLVKPSTGHPRLWHSACMNMHGEVLIFGGCCSNILLDREIMVTSDQVIVLRTSPFTLERLCLHTVYKYQKLLKGGWDTLPQMLHEWLHLKAKESENMILDKCNAISLLGPSVQQLSVISSEDAAKYIEIMF